MSRMMCSPIDTVMVPDRSWNARTIFTALLVGLGVAVLSLTRARHVSQAESRARALRRRAERASVTELTLAKRFELALREFEGRGRVFSSKALDDEETRDRFADLVRSEVQR